MNLETKARRFATNAHLGQLRKDGKTPYIKHCVSVVELLKQEGISDVNILCAAWLHDTIEDCKVTRLQLEREFNPEVLRIVASLTRDIDREAYLERIREADYPVQIVKLADVVHNCAELWDFLPEKTIRRKVEECKGLYLDLAKKLSPNFYELLLKHLSPFIKND